MKVFVIICLLILSYQLKAQFQIEEIDINSFELWKLVDLGVLSIESFEKIRDFITQNGDIKYYYELSRVGIKREEIRELINRTFIGSNELDARLSVYYDTSINTYFRLQGNSFSIQARSLEKESKFFLKANIPKGTVFVGAIQNQMQEFSILNQSDLTVFPDWSNKYQSVLLTRSLGKHRGLIAFHEKDSSTILIHDMVYDVIRFKSKLKFHKQSLEHRNYIQIKLPNFSIQGELRADEGTVNYTRFSVVTSLKNNHLIYIEKTSTLSYKQTRFRQYLKFHRLNIIGEYLNYIDNEIVRNKLATSIIQRFNYRFNLESDFKTFRTRFQGKVLLDDGIEFRQQLQCFHDEGHFNFILGGGIKRSYKHCFFSTSVYRGMGRFKNNGIYTYGFSRRANMIYLSGSEQVVRFLIGNESQKSNARLIVDWLYSTESQISSLSFKLELSRFF